MRALTATEGGLRLCCTRRESAAHLRVCSVTQNDRRRSQSATVRCGTINVILNESWRALTATKRSCDLMHCKGEPPITQVNNVIVFFLTDPGYIGFLYVDMIKPDIAFKSVWWPSTEGLYLFLWEAFLICCSCCPMRNGWLKFLSARKPDWAKIHFKCFWNQKHVTGCLESPTKRGSSAYFRLSVSELELKKESLIKLKAFSFLVCLTLLNEVSDSFTIKYHYREMFLWLSGREFR